MFFTKVNYLSDLSILRLDWQIRLMNRTAQPSCGWTFHIDDGWLRYLKLYVWVAGGIASINSSTSKIRIGFGVLYIVVRKKNVWRSNCVITIWMAIPCFTWHCDLDFGYMLCLFSGRIVLILFWLMLFRVWSECFRLGSLFEIKVIFVPFMFRRNQCPLLAHSFLEHDWNGELGILVRNEGVIPSLLYVTKLIVASAYSSLEHNRNRGLVSLLSLTLLLWRIVVLNLNSSASSFFLSYLISWFETN